MNVYEISVRKLQRVQVKEYEPAEAEITIKAQLEPGEDYHAVMSKLIDDASIGVREGLGLSPSGKIILERTPAPVKTAPTPVKTVPVNDFDDDKPAVSDPPVKRRGRPPKVKPVEDDFGDEPPKPAAKGVDDDFDAEEDSHRRDAGGEDDFGDEPKPVKAEPPKPKKRDDAEEDIRQYIVGLVTNKKISTSDIRFIVKDKFNVTSIRDVPDEYLGELKEAVELKIEADAI